MRDERDLAITAVAADLFGPEGLGEERFPAAPEKYTIERCLGRGGGGSVYLARDLQLGRPVALKYLNHWRPAELERFFREARFAARLNNPSIVQVYEAGEVDGFPFIAMQYIPGGNLATVSLDIPSTLRVARQVAVALEHAHREGIVHRDIKPENVLVDAEERAYVTDFGIARDLRSELGTTISQDGQILGTPNLMSPEQARGDVQAVDARSDIYGLGATLYFKVTGRLPFDADNLVDLLHAVIHDDPPFPRRYRADISRDLESIILRCLRKRREERFQSMREVIDAFERCLSEEGGGGVSPRWFTAFVRSRVDALADLAEYVEPERDWLPALEVVREIAAWDTQLYRVSGDLMRHFPRLDALIARLDRVLEEHPATGWARFYRGVAWFRRGDLRRALDDMERSIDRVRDLAGAYFELGRLYLALYFEEHQAAHRHLSRVGTEGQLRHAHDRLEQAGIAFEEARRLKQDLPGWQVRYAEAARRLAANDFDGCVTECEAILAEDPDLEEVWRLEGDALRRASKDPVPAYTRAVEIRRSCYEALVAIAESHLEAGRRAEARASLERVLEIHSGLVSARVLMARTYLPTADGQPASLDDLQAGLAIVTEALKDNPDRYDAAITAAELQLERGRLSQDAGAIGRALEILDRADQLEGCPNRVNYLRARARLERARLAITSGGDARADLESVLALRSHESTQVPDNRPWLTLFDEASRIRASLP